MIREMVSSKVALTVEIASRKLNHYLSLTVAAKIISIDNVSENRRLNKPKWIFLPIDE